MLDDEQAIAQKKTINSFLNGERNEDDQYLPYRGTSRTCPATKLLESATSLKLRSESRNTENLSEISARLVSSLTTWARCTTGPKFK